MLETFVDPRLLIVMLLIKRIQPKSAQNQILRKHLFAKNTF